MSESEVNIYEYCSANNVNNMPYNYNTEFYGQ